MLSDRIRKLRKALDLTQQEFANRLGIKRNTVATYEIGRSEPIDAVVSLICREFNVNETWLRNGEGEMFVQQSSEAELADMVERLITGESAEFKRRLVRALSTLKDEHWLLLEQKLNEIVGTQGTASSPAPARTVEEEAQAEAEEYYRQILAEKEQAARLQALPDDTDGSTPKMA